MNFVLFDATVGMTNNDVKYFTKYADLGLPLTVCIFLYVRIIVKKSFDLTSFLLSFLMFLCKYCILASSKKIQLYLAIPPPDIPPKLAYRHKFTLYRIFLLYKAFNSPSVPPSICHTFSMYKQDYFIEKN